MHSGDETYKCYAVNSVHHHENDLPTSLHFGAVDGRSMQCHMGETITSGFPPGDKNLDEPVILAVAAVLLVISKRRFPRARSSEILVSPRA